MGDSFAEASAAADIVVGVDKTWAAAAGTPAAVADAEVDPGIVGIGEVG